LHAVEPNRESSSVSGEPHCGHRTVSDNRTGDGSGRPPDGGAMPATASFARPSAEIQSVVHGGDSSGTPRALLADTFVESPNTVTGYSITPDGKRFLFAQPIQPDPPITQIQLVVNWFTELHRAATAK
jgi:hypothetical protein